MGKHDRRVNHTTVNDLYNIPFKIFGENHTVKMPSILYQLSSHTQIDEDTSANHDIVDTQ